MTMATVYKVLMYDPHSDSVKSSRRMATVEGAKAMGGWIVGAAITIDQRDLEGEWQWTALDYEPRNVVLPQRRSLPKAAPFLFDPKKS
jgi:hypothetical protein